jgi:hypothetical protein
MYGPLGLIEKGTLFSVVREKVVILHKEWMFVFGLFDHLRGVLHDDALETAKVYSQLLMGEL